MIDGLAEDDGLAVGVGPREIFDGLLGNPPGAFVEHQHPIHVALVVDAILDLPAEVVDHARRWPPALQVLVEVVDADDLVGRKESVLDTLFEGVRVDRLAEVGEGADLGGLLRGGGQAELDGGLEVVEDLPPCAVLAGAAPVAFVDDHQVEEAAAELLVDVLFFLASADGLVERQVDLVARVHVAVPDLGHHRAEGLEVVGHGLVGEDIPIHEEQHPPDLFRFPQPPDDLEDGQGLSRARGHGQQHPAPAPRDRLHRPLDGGALVVAGLLAAGVLVTGLPGELAGCVVEPFPGAVAPPQVFRGGKFVQADLPLDRGGPSGSVVEQEGVAIRREHEGHVEGFRVSDGLLQPAADRVVVVLGLHHRQRKVRLVEQEVVGPLPLPAHGQLAPNDDPAGREAVFAADLRVGVPSGAGDGRGDVVVADPGFVQGLLVHRFMTPHGVQWKCTTPRSVPPDRFQAASETCLIPAKDSESVFALPPLRECTAGQGPRGSWLDWPWQRLFIPFSDFLEHRQARRAIFEFIEGWYNPHRRHQGLGQQSPIAFERSYQKAA